MLDNVLVSLSEVAKEGGQHSRHKHLTVELPIITLVSLTKVGQVASCKKFVIKKSGDTNYLAVLLYSPSHPGNSFKMSQ